MKPLSCLVVRKRSSQRAALNKVLAVLKRHGARTVVVDRVQAGPWRTRATALPRQRGRYRLGRRYRPFNLVIAVGGDGTFLEAARGVRDEPILGVNSNPGRSVGSFCAAEAATFERVFLRFVRGKARRQRLHRIQPKINGRPAGPPVLNELLVTHRRPAAMSRYWLRVGKRREEQRSSGLWIATAAGSTGAIRSAGGRLLSRRSSRIQYRPRELYSGGQVRYQLRGGVVPVHRPVRVGSLMKEGLVCLDGDHVTFPFRYGDRLEISASDHPLHLIS